MATELILQIHGTAWLNEKDNVKPMLINCHSLANIAFSEEFHASVLSRGKCLTWEELDFGLRTDQRVFLRKLLVNATRRTFLVTVIFNPLISWTQVPKIYPLLSFHLCKVVPPSEYV